MTASLRFAPTQAGPGAPVQLIAAVSSQNGADLAAWSSFGVGATAGLTPPATFADLTHYDAMNGASFSDSDVDLYNTSSAPGNVEQTTTDRRNCQSLQRATGNYAVGKHLWLVLFATGTPSGTDAVLAAAGPYTVV